MKRGTLVTTIVLLGVTIALIAWRAQTVVRGKAIPQLRSMISPEAVAVFDTAVVSHDEYRRNAALWSVAYFGCIFGAAVLSAAAGVILKLDVLAARETLRRDLAAIFAAVGALLITLATIGGFEEKWRGNRLAASGVESAIYDLATPGADIKSVMVALREANRKQDETVVARPSANITTTSTSVTSTQAPVAKPLPVSPQTATEVTTPTVEPPVGKVTQTTTITSTQ